MSLSVRNIKNENSFSLTPKNLEEAMQYAKLIADSDFCPKESKGKPGNVLIAIQYGAELGLSPMQALQNVSVINGRPCLWGDALLGLVKAHPLFINIYEEVKNDVAYCRVERKNSDPVEMRFGIDDAKKAGLWGKPGPWSQYPKRMLQLRARSFALRDAFADVLKGLNMREEVEDYPVKSHTHKKIIEATNVREITNNEHEVINNDQDDKDFKADIDRMMEAETLDELEIYYKNSYKFWAEKKDKVRLTKIIEIKDKRKNELEIKQFQDELGTVDVETGEVK